MLTSDGVQAAAGDRDLSGLQQQQEQHKSNCNGQVRRMAGTGAVQHLQADARLAPDSNGTVSVFQRRGLQSTPTCGMRSDCWTAFISSITAA